MFERLRIGFVGGGNMGEALIKGIISASLVARDRLHVYDISSSRTGYLKENYQINVHRSLARLAEMSQVLVLAVKPQNMSEVLDELSAELAHMPLVISIAAGVTLASLSKRLPEELPLIRVMPNTPALVMEGASALARGSHVTDTQMHLAVSLFQAVGRAIEVEEKWMDTVTGLSGSGPAYVLLVLEALIDGGVLMGLPRQISRELAVQTVLGTAKMVQETGKHPAELKDMITSPGGTTIHGLQVMEQEAVRGALIGAVKAASERSGELGKDS
ncbi:pyrroline-5-carboxylate reductase [Desulfoferrobacter suflitae]|uniref:pyrroline-5-carboxylate reductase n=1 Tax=Desulfoferrobacter suflitae TaxID=2865782 RepID=UPI0021648F17|nr:pyrroline-5-carboxylate reductase [Desulfoferrobacter suflitae]MCK8602026.1 pyrroline-5-carboxylate reductase [Desulfoferrobacter suflitae]